MIFDPCSSIVKSVFDPHLSILTLVGKTLYNGCSYSETNDETFVWNFYMKFLCVSYITVQMMKLLHATSHYLLLLPAKIMHICIKPCQHGAYWGGQNCCPIVSDCHCTCNAIFKWTANNTKLLDKKVDSMKKCIWGSPCFVRGTSKWRQRA